MRGGLEDRRPVRANLEPRELDLVQKPLHRSVTAENDAPESRLRPFVGPARAYGTPDFDPSEPIPFVLTAAGERAAEELELEELEDDELEDDDELDDVDDDGNPIDFDDDDELEDGRPW